MARTSMIKITWISGVCDPQKYNHSDLFNASSSSSFSNCNFMLKMKTSIIFLIFCFHQFSVYGS